MLLRTEEHGSRREMEILDVKGTTGHIVLSDLRLRNLYWLRDGRVVYVRADPSFPTKGETCNFWVAKIDERTDAFISKPVQLTHNRGFCIDDISATDDSKRLVFTKWFREVGVYVADVKAGGATITPPRHLGLIEAQEYPESWTADSREVIVISNRDEKWGVYREPLSGGPVQQVFVENTSGISPPFGVTQLSPDGGWVTCMHFDRGLVRVPMGGGREELVAEGFFNTLACAAPSTSLCTYSKLEKNHLVFMSFDPQHKQGRELGRFTEDPNQKEFYDWGLSPDATRIAIHPVATGSIYLLNLKTQDLQQIIVKHWSNLENMSWTADGKGFFICSHQPDGVLLHVDLHGNAQVLWEPSNQGDCWVTPSPDGKHVAMPLTSTSFNVWMMENF
jgi:eukaryotic-like serine/threonine-protein kinase